VSARATYNIEHERDGEEEEIEFQIKWGKAVGEWWCVATRAML
jgi:hypothetical protein